jgi:hypothetical protein
MRNFVIAEIILSPEKEKVYIYDKLTLHRPAQMKAFLFDPTSHIQFLNQSDPELMRSGYKS